MIFIFCANLNDNSQIKEGYNLNFTILKSKTFTDHLNCEVTINYPPKKIISLVPSQTELLYDLGLKDEIVGITKFCIHPKELYKSKTHIGGTKNFDFDKIRDLSPDLIIANKEENYREGIDELKKEFPVWISDVSNLEDCCKMIENIGQLVGKESKAKSISTSISHSLTTNSYSSPLPTVAYFIWKNPYMSIGNDTFIHNMLRIAGFNNVFEEFKRYPVVTEAQILEKLPEYIFLSSEPYPFKEKHIEEFQKISPKSKIILVDGEMFSWHGSRILYAADYFKALKARLKL